MCIVARIVDLCLSSTSDVTDASTTAQVQVRLQGARGQAGENAIPDAVIAQPILHSGIHDPHHHSITHAHHSRSP